MTGRAVGHQPPPQSANDRCHTGELRSTDDSAATSGGSRAIVTGQTLEQ